MTTPSTGQVADRLAAYADSLRQDGAIRTSAVHAAFATVPRHRFLPHFCYRADEYTLDTSEEPPGDVLDIVYANNSLLTHTGRDGRSPGPRIARERPNLSRTSGATREREGEGGTWTDQPVRPDTSPRDPRSEAGTRRMLKPSPIRSDRT